MQMYDIVATGVLGLLVGFWSGRSIRWKMEETEETGEDREERKNTAVFLDLLILLRQFWHSFL